MSSTPFVPSPTMGRAPVTTMCRVRAFTHAPFAALVVVTTVFTGAACNRTPTNPPARCDDLICTNEVDEDLHTVVNGTDRDAWVYFDFESGGQVDDVDDADDSTAWDLGIRRMVVKSNGGVNGTGNMEACILDDTDYETLVAVPGCEFISDVDSRFDPRDPGGTVFNDDTWYDYDLIDHTLRAKIDRVYVVKSVEGTFYKLQFLDYYNTEGIAAWPSFRWSTLAAF